RRPLTEHWNGNEWSVIPSPDVTDRSLYSVGSVGPNDVWAAGAGGLIEHWNGTQWSIITSSTTAELRSIAALTARDIWAVGFTEGGPGQTVTVHWDGTQWSVIPSANVGTGNNQLFSVAGVSSDEVWAVGTYQSSTTYYTTLMLQWDGSGWSVVP